MDVSWAHLGLALWHNKLRLHLQHLHYIWELVQVLAAPLPIQRPANTYEKADDPSTSCTYVENLEEVPGSWLKPEATVAIVGISAASQQILFLSPLFLFLPVSIALHLK